MKKIILFSIFIVLCFSARSHARFNPGWKWRTIRTDHFTVYYPEGHEAAAGRILGLSEEVYDDVTGYLGVTPRRCPIVLHPGTDLFNGWFSVFPNRIVLYETPLYSLKQFGPGSDLMDLVYTHEYTHYVHMTTRLGLYGFISRIIGDGFAISNALSPGWIIEGVTTETETIFTDGGRGRSSLFRGRMMSFTEDGGLWGLSSSGTSPPYSPPADRIYLSGYFMVEYMNRTYGRDTFPKLGRYQARNPLGSTRKALKDVTDKKPKAFYEDFLTDFEARTTELKRSVDDDELLSGTVILSEPFDDLKAHFWTENGTIKVLRRGYDNKNAVVEIEPDSGKIISEKSVGVLFNLQPVRNIPGGSLVFGEVFQHPLGEGELDVSDLVIFDPETNIHKRLTNGSHIYSADVSPDGKRFVAARRNGMWIELILLNADGSDERTLISVPGTYFEAPVWSPDGSKIAAVYKTGNNADIVLIDPGSGTMEPLFETDIHEDNEPSFSPDGRWIVFSSDRSGIWNIYAWDLNDRRLYQLNSVYYAAGEPRVSPDMKTLSFFSINRGVNTLCVMPFEPLSGKPAPISEIARAGKSSDFTHPDLDRLQPDAELDSSGIPFWEAYKPFVHAPSASIDEKGNKLGVFLIGADPVGLNAYSAELLYGVESERPGYDINFVNTSLWPLINLRTYDSTVEHNTLGSMKDQWFRERGGSVSFLQNVIHRNVPSTVVATYSAGARIRRFDDLAVHNIGRNRDTSLGIFGELTVRHRPDSARRDVVPNGSHMLYIARENGLGRFGGEIPGYNTIVLGKYFISSPLIHHGFELTFAHQNQSGFLNYDKTFCIPRGYRSSDSEGDINMRKNLLMSLEYHFPLWYADKGIGVILYHMNLLKGSFFIDYGAGWNEYFIFDDWRAKARTTVGATLIAKSAILSWLPIDVGILAGKKIRDNETFAQLIIKIDSDVLNNRTDFKRF
ncbi:TolB family protein [Candidatus Latescibacterota bacterium]